MKIYLDTSVIGGYYDDEFKKETRKLFKDFEKGNHVPLLSVFTVDELHAGAPKKVITLIDNLEQYGAEYILVNQATIELANKYIAEGIVSTNYEEDASHIAIASVYDADVLVSWNFKHIVNLAKITEFNRVNKSLHYLHYKELEIRSPQRVLLWVSVKRKKRLMPWH